MFVCEGLPNLGWEILPFHDLVLPVLSSLSLLIEENFEKISERVVHIFVTLCLSIGHPAKCIKWICLVVANDLLRHLVGNQALVTTKGDHSYRFSQTLEPQLVKLFVSNQSTDC